MVSAPELGQEARRFAETLQDLLNRTVCDYAQVNTVISRRGTGMATVGTRLSRVDLSVGKIPMRSSARTKVSIEVSCTVFLNDEGFLTVKSSYCGVWLGEEQDDLLLHYDYEREKDLYTEAHVQVGGSHPALEQILGEVGRPGDHMKDLHFPVGGRRLRPSLEDLLESLIAERLIDGKPGYKEVLDETRRTYRLKQIGALVRSNQKTAIETLQGLGYVVTKKDAGLLSRVRQRGKR